MLTPWVLGPLVAALLLVGVGALAERAARLRVPGALVPVIGLAGLIAVMGVLTVSSVTAPLAVPVVAGLAAAGLVAGRPWRRLRAGLWPAVTAAGAYALFAAPSLLSGQGSIAGFISLDDSATWLALTDHVMAHGRDLSGLPASTHAATLDAYLGEGYPVGAFLLLGAVGRLTGIDIAELYQPTIAVGAALTALGIWACARPLAGPRGAAFAALAGVQASLFLGYAQWGGIKEVMVAALLPALAWTATRAAREPAWAALALAGLAAAALLALLGPLGAVWAAPAPVIAAAVLLRRGGHRRATAAVLAGIGALAVVPALASARLTEHLRHGALSRQDDLGNLVAPLELLQGAGLWPSGDFRAATDPRAAGVLLAVAGLAAAASAFAIAARRGHWELPVLAGAAVLGTAASVVAGSPWVDAKALAVVAPFLLAGGAALPWLARREAGAVLAVVIAAACAWSTAAVLRDVRVAPRERLAELREVGEVVAGRGPALLLDFEIYGSRHFLRDAPAEGATDLRLTAVVDRDGRPFAEGTTADTDEIAPAALWRYPVLVRRRNPVASRPPAAYARVFANDGYEVWERTRQAPPPIDRLALGDDLAPAAVPDCTAVGELARRAGVRRLAAVPGRFVAVVDLRRAAIPPPWRSGEGVVPAVDGRAAAGVELPQAGRYRVWVGGSALGRLEVTLAGRQAGGVRHALANDGQWLRLGAVRARAGTQVITLDYERGAPWHAGRGRADAQAPLGPVAVTHAGDDGPAPVVRVDARAYRRLCDGRAYDWIEAEG